MRCLIPSILLLVWCATAVFSADNAGDQRGQDFFEKRIRPVLVGRCYKCHSAKSEEIGGKLLFDTREGTLTGGETGPAIVPKNIKGSLLIDAIEYKSMEMPPNEQHPQT